MAASGTLDFQSDADLSGGAGGSLLVHGTLTRSSTGTNATAIGVLLDTTPGSQVRASAGTLQLTQGDGAAGQSGTFAGSSGVVEFSSGSFDLETGSTFTGTIALPSGTLTIASGVVVPSPGTFTQSGGTLSGDGELLVSGSYLWSSGTQGEGPVGSGVTRITADATFTRAGTSFVALSGRTLRIEGAGAITTTNIGSSIDVSSGGAIEVAASGTLDFQSDADLSGGAGGSLLVHGTSPAAPPAPTRTRSGSRSRTTGSSRRPPARSRSRAGAEPARRTGASARRRTPP